MSIDHGGQAFPTEGGSDSGLYPDPGMSLRDYFAAAALTGLLSSNATYGGKTNNYQAIATDAYAHADAMLTASLAITKAQGQEVAPDGRGSSVSGDEG